MIETFTERFARLIKGLSDTEAGSIMGITADAVRKLRLGDIKSIKLDAAVRLCRHTHISPYYLAGEREPVGPEDATLGAGSSAANEIRSLVSEISDMRAEMARLKVADRLGSLEAKVGAIAEVLHLLAPESEHSKLDSGHHPPSSPRQEVQK